MTTTFSSYFASLLLCVLLYGGGTILARPERAAGDEYYRKSVAKKQALPEAIEALIGRGGGNPKTAKEEGHFVAADADPWSPDKTNYRTKSGWEAKYQENKKNKGTESANDFSTGASSSSSDAWSTIRINYRPNSKAKQEQKKN